MKTLNVKLPGSPENAKNVTIPVKSTSGPWSLPSLRDLIQGLIMAALTPVLVIIQQTLDAGFLVLEWKSLLMAAVAGAGAYLLRKLPQSGVVVIKKSEL